MTTGLLERSASVDRTDARPEPRPRPFFPRWHWAALGLVTVLGAAVRVRGFTDAGLWRDDAWVALSSRVGIGTAWHMWATAPGFYFVERSWMVLHIGSTSWAQVVPFALGVAAMPAAFALARVFGFGRRTSLCCTLVVAMSPVCLMYSTRLKEYGADFLLACLLLGLGESARRRATPRSFALLGLVSVLSFGVSASTALVVVAVWIALTIDVVGRRAAHPASRRTFLSVGAVSALVCLVEEKVLYRHISPRLQQNWSGFYISHNSLIGLVASAHARVLVLCSGLVGTYDRSPLQAALLFTVVTVLLVAGMTVGRDMLAPTLVLVFALGAALADRIPIGTGRTDEVLYPALLLLGASGLRRIRFALGRHVPRLSVRRVAVALIAVVVTGILLNDGLTLDTQYPATDVRTLAVEIHQAMRPGDHIVVRSLMRYPWALYEDEHLTIRFGTAWSTGFTVANTEPGVFIIPSQRNEGDVNPSQWASEVSGYHRLWFVGVGSLAQSPTFRILHRSGWHAVETLYAPGCQATLVVR